MGDSRRQYNREMDAPGEEWIGGVDVGMPPHSHVYTPKLSGFYKWRLTYWLRRLDEWFWGPL